MIVPTRLGLFLAIFFSYPIPDAAAGLNKCTDGKQITYTTEPCEKTGLTSAGPIKDAVTVMPFVPVQQRNSSEKSGKEHVAGNDVPVQPPPGEDVPDTGASREITIKPVNPLVNKLLNW